MQKLPMMKMKRPKSILNNYECYNSIFGDAESIFMGRSSSHASTTDYKFSFPAFAFDVLQNDQLFMVSRCEMISPKSLNSISNLKPDFRLAQLSFVLLVRIVLQRLILINGQLMMILVTQRRQDSKQILLLFPPLYHHPSKIPKGNISV